MDNPLNEFNPVDNQHQGQMRYSQLMESEEEKLNDRE